MTPDSEHPNQSHIRSNKGRIVVDKVISEIELSESSEGVTHQHYETETETENENESELLEKNDSTEKIKWATELSCEYDEISWKSVNLLNRRTRSLEVITRNVLELKKFRHSEENLRDLEDFSFVKEFQFSNIQTQARRKTFRKSKKIDSTISDISRQQSSECNDIEFDDKMCTSFDDESKIIEQSNDTVFCSEDNLDDDLYQVEVEYLEHVKSNLQRDYKSDGDSLDEVGKDLHKIQWKNHSVEFDENVRSMSDKIEPIKEFSESPTKPLTSIMRKESNKRTKSEGDRPDITISEPNIKANLIVNQTNNSSFEKSFVALKKINKFLKVKRFSSSALYDKNKVMEIDTNISESYRNSESNSSKTSLASPKSLKSKKKSSKRRKFSFFSKSHSNNDLNINLKSLASKLSLISKSNFDLSKNLSNLRLNSVGTYSKNGVSTEYRSDILSKNASSCFSPVSEAFYNATGSYQLTPMELFEKFCSTDFTGLYKNESNYEEDQIHQEYALPRGAIKKKNLLHKQNSEPKFNFKECANDQQFYHPKSFLDSEIYEEDEGCVESYQDRSSCRRRSSFDKKYDYHQDYEKFYEYEEDLLEVSREYRSNEDISAIDETDEENVDENGDYDDDGFQGTVQIHNDAEDDNTEFLISKYVEQTARLGDDLLKEITHEQLMSKSSETLNSIDNTESFLNTMKQMNFDSCCASNISLSLNSEILDDQLNGKIKTVTMSQLDDFTLTPDDSMGHKILQEKEMKLCEISSQHSLECEELEADSSTSQNSQNEKNNFAEVLNKEFDKLFIRMKNDSDTDLTLTATPSAATVLTAIKISSRSVDKIDVLPLEFPPSDDIPALELTKSITSSDLQGSTSTSKDEEVDKMKAKRRSLSVGAINKKKHTKKENVLLCNHL